MTRVKIEVTGIVQGVGFRPFVYNLARSMGIKGFVLNDSKGVIIEAEGDGIDGFIQYLKTSYPPLAQIEDIKTSILPPAGYKGFEIRESLSDEGLSTLISPDIAICKDCLKELFDSSDRRYLYPFINCTNCGPRYSIIHSIPYDRPNTTMKAFRMCKDCEEEYHDPSNRRFHAQPNACPECGPKLQLQVTSHKWQVKEKNPIGITIELLREGAIVAIKGIGGFHLACDATNDAAVKRLRGGKRRSNKPFAVMMPDMKTIRSFCEVTPGEGDILKGPIRPVVLLKKRRDIVISDFVAPENNYLGVMLPYTPLHYLLFYYPLTHHSSPTTRHHFNALVMTSGNLSEEPIVTDNQDALERLSSIADAFLLHNRGIYMRVDDSVVRIYRDGETETRRNGVEEKVNLSYSPHHPFSISFSLIRRARGYAPSPIDLGREMPQVLATGGELKTTFCLTKGRYAILSQHIGDMENKEAIEFYKETLRNLKNTFKVEPEIIAHDLHPNYWTTTFAKQFITHNSSLITVPVQHHHAHIASCMAEHGLIGKVIGIAMDGTGYGSDGMIWGGEFLIADEMGFERFAHLEYIPMPGGEKAINEPYRMALSYLYHTFGDKTKTSKLCPWFLERFDQRVLKTLIGMIKGRINSPLTSSCGRLFDAVSSILGIRDFIAFEGEAAITMEMKASHNAEGSYGFEIKGFKPCIIDVRPMIEGLIGDIKNGTDLPVMAGKFHNTIVKIILELSRIARKETSLKKVVLSGGCFQNSLLLRKAVSRLKAGGFDVFTHRVVPTNDGGVSLGQALIASSRINLLKTTL